GPPAQERTAFEQQNPPPGLGQIDGCGEAGEAATDDKDRATGRRGDWATGRRGDRGHVDFRTHLFSLLFPHRPVASSPRRPVALAHSLNAMRNLSGLCNLIRLLKTS